MTLTLDAFPVPLSHALEGWGTEGGCSSFRVRGTCELPWGTALRERGTVCSQLRTLRGGRQCWVPRGSSSLPTC